MHVKLVGGNRAVSIYCDHHDALGYMGKPYWEAMMGGETERYLLDKTSKLVSDVKKYLKNELQKQKIAR
jgi:hypothetical protein